MMETTLKGPAMLPKGLAEKMSVGFEKKGGKHVPAEPMQIGPHAPAGAIASTAADMATWMLVHMGRGQLGDVRILSEETHELMWTRAFTDRDSGADLAHGFMTKPYYGYATFAHGGGTSAFYTMMVLVPDLGLGIFVSQNSTDDRGLVMELPDLIIQRLAGEDRGPGETEAGEALLERAAECAGRFMNNRRSFTRFEKIFAAAMSFMTVTAADDGSVIVSVQGKVTRYTPLAGTADTYQDRFGNRIVFGRDETGRVSHYTGPWGVHSYERVGTIDAPGSLGIVVMLVVLFTITSWMGMLWRRGVPATHTRTSRLLGIASSATTVAVVVFIAVAAWTASTMSSISASDLIDYPPTAVVIFRTLALLFFVVGIAAAASLWPAWRSSGWGIPRKIHHSLFALSLLALAIMMVRWNIVFASITG
jgi:hypothetical protein